VDFIFGSATAFFEQCRIHCLRSGYITAASTPEDQPFGFVFSNCRITGETNNVKTYLGRPWRIHASTIFLNTEMSDVVRPEGWNDWDKPETHTTARYAEWNSAGPTADPKARVPWAQQLTRSEADAITARRVVGGADGWDPAATAPARTPGLARVRADIEYGTAGSESLKLDVGMPEGAGPFPVAIVVHGGGWGSGDKQKDINLFFDPLTKANLTWFSINYRLAPTSHWPACFEDVQTAVRWVKAHAAEYNGDPQRIALIGYSAGGQLVCQAAVLAKEDTRVQAVVGFAAPTDLMADTERRGGLSPPLKDLLARQNLDEEVKAILREMSPLNHVHPGLPPFLLIHGTLDKSVPYEQSPIFQAKLKENGVACDLITVTNAPHAIAAWEKIDTSYKEKMALWLKETLGGAK
jgi:acetyl esterase/lipase